MTFHCLHKGQQAYDSPLIYFTGQLFSSLRTHVRSLLCTDKAATSPAMSATVLERSRSEEQRGSEVSGRGREPGQRRGAQMMSKFSVILHAGLLGLVNSQDFCSREIIFKAA